MIREEILMMQTGINPRMIERKLNSFLPPHLRAKHFDRLIKQSRTRGKTKPLSEEAFGPAAAEGKIYVAAENDF